MRERQKEREREREREREKERERERERESARWDAERGCFVLDYLPIVDHCPDRRLAFVVVRGDAFVVVRAANE